MNHLKQIEFLEKKVAKNLDETSYSELVKLKSQLNRGVKKYRFLNYNYYI